MVSKRKKWKKWSKATIVAPNKELQKTERKAAELAAYLCCACGTRRLHMGSIEIGRLLGTLSGQESAAITALCNRITPEELHCLATGEVEQAAMETALIKIRFALLQGIHDLAARRH